MKKETRVYVINCENNFDFRHAEQFGEEEKIIDKAEELGSIYSLSGFQNAINDEELDLTNSFILIK